MQHEATWSQLPNLTWTTTFFLAILFIINRMHKACWELSACSSFCLSEIGWHGERSVELELRRWSWHHTVALHLSLLTRLLFLNSQVYKELAAAYTGWPPPYSSEWFSEWTPLRAISVHKEQETISLLLPTTCQDKPFRYCHASPNCM